VGCSVARLTSIAISTLPPAFDAASYRRACAFPSSTAARSLCCTRLQPYRQHIASSAELRSTGGTIVTMTAIPVSLKYRNIGTQAVEASSSSLTTIVLVLWLNESFGGSQNVVTSAKALRY